MKKIVVLVVSLILFPKLYWAEENYFYLDTPIEGIYTMMDVVTKVAANYVKPVRKVGTNEYVYCVTPGIAINSNGNYQKINNNPWNTLNISKEKYEKIQIISYFGYMYKNHTDLKWYAVTQYLIWQEVLPSGWSVYFTNTLRGPKSSDFDWMINELQELVNSYYQNPNFSYEVEGNYKNSVTLFDSNQVLHNFQTSNNTVSIQNNSIVLSPSNDDYFFTIDYITDNKQSDLYTYNNAQWVISRGSLPKRSIDYKVVIPKGSLQITKTISNLNDIDIEYNPNLEGAKYRLFNDSYNEEYLTDKNGIINLSNLNIDNYYLREVSAPDGLEIDNNLYSINIVANSKTNIYVEDNLIISKINIFKKYLNIDSNSYENESGAKFAIMDENNNILDIKNTNNDGYVSFSLPLGKYIVSQLSGLDNYDKIKNEEIILENNQAVDLNYYNRPIAIKLDNIEENLSIPEEKNIETEEQPPIEIINEEDSIIDDQKEEEIEAIDDVIMPIAYIDMIQSEETILNTIDNNIEYDMLPVNPQTSDNIKLKLLINISSIIIFTLMILKKLLKKKEI